MHTLQTMLDNAARALETPIEAPAWVLPVSAIAALLAAALGWFIARRLAARNRDESLGHDAPSNVPRRRRSDEQPGTAALRLAAASRTPKGSQADQLGGGSPDAACAGEKTVLIIDDDVYLAQAISMRLKRLGLNVVKTTDALHALMGVYKLRPDLAIIDVNMPSGNGLALCEMLATVENCRSIPIIVYTGTSDQGVIDRCRQLGHHYVHKSTTSWDELRSHVCRLLDLPAGADQPDTDAVLWDDTPLPGDDTPEDARLTEEKPPGIASGSADASPTCAGSSEAKSTEEQPPRVAVGAEAETPCRGPAEAPTDTDAAPAPTETGAARRPCLLCIDDDPDVSRAIALRLSTYGIDVVRALDGTSGFYKSLECNPDVILTDMVMPNGEGNYVFGRLRSHPLTKDIPIVVITGQAHAGLKREMFALGAEAYLQKPIRFNELLGILRRYIALPDQGTPPTEKPRSLLAACQKQEAFSG